MYSNYTLVTARYAYLWGRPDKGAEYLQPIVDAYFDLGIVDDNFLYMRGMPFFSETWSCLVAFAWMSGSYDAADELIARAKADLSEYDFENLDLYYQCHKRSDYAEYTDALAHEIEQLDATFPSGFQRIQLAALHAFRSNDPESAILELDGVEFGEEDFPWLADVALVHRARIHWKAGQADAEAAERTEFLERQPMLFEPEHAYAFAFLDYQEELRPVYQKSRSEHLTNE